MNVVTAISTTVKTLWLDEDISTFRRRNNFRIKRAAMMYIVPSITAEPNRSPGEAGVMSRLTASPVRT
jgi:hypothetical protein